MVETQRLENLLEAFWAFEERATCVISNRDRHTLCRWLCTRCLGLPEKVGQWDPWCLVIWWLIGWLMGWLLGKNHGVMRTNCSQCPSTSRNATGNSRGEGLERYSAGKSGGFLRLTDFFFRISVDMMWYFGGTASCYLFFPCMFFVFRFFPLFGAWPLWSNTRSKMPWHRVVIPQPLARACGPVFPWLASFKLWPKIGKTFRIGWKLDETC